MDTIDRDATAHLRELTKDYPKAQTLKEWLSYNHYLIDPFIQETRQELNEGENYDIHVISKQLIDSVILKTCIGDETGFEELYNELIQFVKSELK